MTLQKVAEGDYQVTLPSWRLDLEREIDLIEEIARVYGYNRFANTLPSFLRHGERTCRTHAKKRWFARRLLGAGLERGSLQHFLLCY